MEGAIGVREQRVILRYVRQQREEDNDRPEVEDQGGGDVEGAVQRGM